MKRASHSETPATQFLKKHGVAYREHFYDYVEHGGAERGAEALGVPGNEVVKTLVMEDEGAAPLIVLMHGDRKVSGGVGHTEGNQTGLLEKIAPSKQDDKG